MHLLSIRELSTSQILELLQLSQELKNKYLNGKTLPNLSNKVVGMLFLEDSTRTRLSFEQAARNLHLECSYFGMQGTSMSKGESLKDTVLTLRHEGLEALVMRHNSGGAPYLAARFFGKPVINAGDGMHEHPTQALTDALTVLEHKKRISELRVAIVGDVLHSRVARSDLWIFHKLGAEVRLVGPRNLLPKHPGLLPASLHYDLRTGIHNADVVIALRLQKERMESGLISSINEYADLYQINTKTIQSAKEDCLVMHPGPINRGIELDDRTADGAHSVILKQVENGIFVRMAVFVYLLHTAPKKAQLKKTPTPPKGKPAKTTTKPKAKKPYTKRRKT
ncbi:MAG: aspartate carbamoyltransferase catalytic subunit [Candidatus Caldarchaeum sp.]